MDHLRMGQAEKFETGAHVALLDVMSGAGILVAPPGARDVYLGGPVSLHASSWDSMVRALFKQGWTLLSDEDELPIVIANLDDGSVVHGLYPYLMEQDTESPSLEDDRDFSMALMRLVEEYDASR